IRSLHRAEDGREHRAVPAGPQRGRGPDHPPPVRSQEEDLSPGPRDPRPRGVLPAGPRSRRRRGPQSAGGRAGVSGLAPGVRLSPKGAASGSACPPRPVPRHAPANLEARRDPRFEAGAKMKRKRVILLVVAVLAAAGALGWWLGAKRKDKPLVLSGTIEARDVEVGSLLGGRIAKIFVEEGAARAAGAPILQFDTDLIDLPISQQKAKIAQAQANLTKALRGPRTEEISSARALAENAETERLRQKRLLGEGVVPQQSYDAAATQARTTREALL